MLFQLAVFFISIVVRINLSSQKMLLLHVQFITLWDWFVKNVKHPEVQEWHTIPGSPTYVCRNSGGQMEETSIDSTEKDRGPIHQSPTRHYCQIQGWTVNEITGFCHYCTLTLTVGARRGESYAWPCYWLGFAVSLQSSASPWHQAQAASAQQFCKLGISCFILCYICWIAVIKADAYLCIDMPDGRGEMLDLCCLNMMTAKREQRQVVG